MIFVNKKLFRCLLTWPVTIAVFLLNSTLAAADTLIRGEFEYNVDERELSEWQIGPAFSLGDSDQLELEIPIGQDNGEWITEPELTYEFELGENTSLELSVGAEVPLSEVGETIQPFGSVELGVDF